MEKKGKKRAGGELVDGGKSLFVNRFKSISMKFFSFYFILFPAYGKTKKKKIFILGGTGQEGEGIWERFAKQFDEQTIKINK